MKLESVLLVDDDPPTNYLHTHLFRKMGYQGLVMEASGADAALNYLEATPFCPQLVFLDLNMPRISGWEFLQLYARRFRPDDALVVVLTTSLNPSDEARAQTSPYVKGFYRKPLTKELLQDVVTRRFDPFW